MSNPGPDPRTETQTTAGVVCFLNVAGRPQRVLLESWKEKEKGKEVRHFKGTTETPLKLEIATFVREVLGDAAAEDLPELLRELKIERLGADYQSKVDFAFLCEATLAIEGKPVRILLSVGKKAGKITVGGTLTLGRDADGKELEFSLRFSKDTAKTTFLAALENASIDVRSLAAAVSDELADSVPDGLKIQVERALFAYQGEKGAQQGAPASAAAGSPGGKQSRCLFALSVSLKAGFDLSGLPLVGSQFPKNQKVGLDDLQILACKGAFDQATLSDLNQLLAEGSGESRAGESGAKAGGVLPDFDLASGVHVAALMRLGAAPRRLALPIGKPPAKSADPPPAKAEPAPEPAAEPLMSLGPVHINKVGLAYREGAAWVMLDAAIIGGGMTLTLDGLGFGCKLSAPWPPKFALEGVGLSYKGGSVSLSGMFRHKQIELPDGKTRDQYAGAAILQAPALSLSAIGAYEEIDGEPSLFLYAILDKPIGGPSFFFVTGLAAGFGYNRRLILPTIDEIEDFPLIAAAMQKGSGGDSLEASMKMLDNLQKYLPASPGNSFVAVGVRFTSFKIIESFALVTVAFGKRFEIGLLGISTLVAPPKAGKTPIARVQIGLVARIDAEKLQIDGKILKGSFVFSKDCTLSGGFAFYCWFSGEHGGDFVLTVGGYHPKFNVPAHYPTVDRLALNWQISDKLSVKGSCYFALTASALMAGGALEAVYQDGNLKAWFKAGADFLIVWEPYSYDARIYVSIGASYKFRLNLGFVTINKTITIEVGADVHIWGPEFAGTATVHIFIITFTIEFGDHSPKPQPIPWTAFRDSFLPKPQEVCTLTVQSGLVDTVKAENGDGEVWVVNPKSFSLLAESAIPFTETNQLKDFEIVLAGSEANVTRPAIRSMMVAADRVRSRLVVTITGPQKESFELRPIHKNVPMALWGAPTAELPNPNDERLLAGALAGLEIRPLPPPPPDNSSVIERDKLLFNLDSHPHTYAWGSLETFEDFKEGGHEQKPPSPVLLAAFGLDPSAGTGG